MQVNTNAPQFGKLKKEAKSNLTKAAKGAAATVGAAWVTSKTNVPMTPDDLLVAGGAAYTAEKASNAVGMSPFAYIKARTKQIIHSVTK